MLKTPPQKIEDGRLVSGTFATERGWMTGYFRVQGPCGEKLTIVSSEGDIPGADGWEHVSVSTARRCPNWIEMCFVKDLFFGPEETVIQFHPPQSEYVNNHPYCLHLWRKVGFEFPRPPAMMVGKKDAGILNKETARALHAEMGVKW